MRLEQQKVDFFWEHGYLKYGTLLKEEELGILREAYDRLFSEAQNAKKFRNLSADGDQRASAVKMLQITQACARSMVFRRLLYDTRILDVIEAFIGPNIMLFHDQALFKPAHCGGAVPWHQDNGYWQLYPATAVSCWITLDDVDRENGAMQVLPGSHLRPHEHETNAQSSALKECMVDASLKPVVVALPAGGAMFHHCQTLHYTAPNTTPRQRRAFAIHYMAPGTRNKEGITIEVGFDHPLLRARI